MLRRHHLAGVEIDFRLVRLVLVAGALLVGDDRGPEQEVGDRDVRHHLEEGIRDERHLVDLAAHEVLHERRGATLQRRRGFAERSDLGAHAGLFGVCGDEIVDLGEEGGEVLTAALLQLAGDQIERLNVIGAFVDREDLGVATVLLDRVVLHVAGAAVGLDRELGDPERLVGAVGFHDRRQQIDLALMVERLRLVDLVERVREIGMERELDAERTHAFDLGLHLEEHAADVGVLDDRHARRVRVLEMPDRRSLQPLARVAERVQIRRRRDRKALHADGDPRAVHHTEHLFHAHVRLAADENAAATVVLAEAQHGRRGGADAELVLDRGGLDVVRLAERAVVVHPHLRDDEERDAPGAGRRAFDAGEHEVDDVVGEVVITGRDPTLGPLDRVDVALEVLGARLGGADVRAGVGLGEAHRPGELPGDHGGKKALAVFGQREARNHVGGAVREARVHVEGAVGAALQLFQHDRDRVRTAQAPVLDRHRKSHEPELEEFLPGVLEPLRRHHLSALDRASDAVGRTVDRTGHVVHEAMALLDDRVALVARDVREGVEPEHLLHLQVLVERELDRAQIGLEVVDRSFGHMGGSSSS